MTRQEFNPEDLPDTAELGFNQAIVQDETLYMSGQVGWDGEFDVVGDDIKSQARKAFENVEVVLSEVDKTLEDITKVRTYMVNPHERNEDYREVWQEVFGSGPYPCQTLLGVEQLAREGLLVEIEIEVPL